MTSGGGKRRRATARDARARWRVAHCAWMVVVAATAASAARGRRRWRRTRDDANARDETTSNLTMSDVCLYSPATIERARSALPRMASTWRGTVSVAVLADLKTPGDALDLSAMASELEGDAGRIAITMVEALPEYENRFPVNFLRNLAREKCVAELGAKYVLAHDVDFEVFVAPDEDAFLNDVRNVLGKRSGEKVRRALVVPAFQLHAVWSQRVNAKRDAILNARRVQRQTKSRRNEGKDDDESIDAVVDSIATKGDVRRLNPMSLYETLVERDRTRTVDSKATAINLTLPYSTRERLDRLVRERRLANGFQINYFPIAHAPTNYTAWFENTTTGADSTYRVATPKHPWYYEPYVIVRADLALPFDESFVQYGFNKISFVHELAAAGFDFHVTKNAHTVHTNTHPTRAMANMQGQDLARCRAHPAASNDFRIARVGHSCIPAFLRRMECAYGFTLDDLEFGGVSNAPPPDDLLFRLQSDDNIVCFGGCITDLEDAPRTPATVTVRGGRFVGVTQGSDARRRKRGPCERFDVALQ